MSYDRMLKTVNLENSGGFALNETLCHPSFMKKVTGIDPFDDPLASMLAAVKKLGFDWVYGIPKYAHKFDKSESKKKIGEGAYLTEWGYTGSGWSEHTSFGDIEDVLTFDPFTRFQSEEALRTSIRAGIGNIMEDQALCGDTAVVSGLYYTMLFQWFILEFGWEMFLVAAASEPERFELCLERYTRLSQIFAEEYAASPIPFFFCHDDLAMTRGLVFAPEWYRKYIFPAYECIFDPFRKVGKKIVFVSDGNYSELIDDLFAVGIDGIMVDWTFDLAGLIKKYGGSKLIAGNADTVVLTFGSREDVRREALRCLDSARGAPGYVMKCFNDLPQNIPMENIETYFDTIAEYREKM